MGRHGDEEDAMTRDEFLDTLRMQLQGELSAAQIEAHLHYYREYISDAMRAGKSEAEVLAELGSPVFIAHTLVDSAQGAQDSASAWGEDAKSTGSADADAQEQPEAAFVHNGKVHKIHPWVIKFGVPIVLFLILFLILSLIGNVLTLVVRFFVPILLVILVILLFRRG